MTALSDRKYVRFFLPSLRAAAEGRDCFMIGGAIRDWLLDRASSDFDFATPYDPTNLAQKFAAAIQGHWFSLDTTRHQSRVVADANGGCCTFDFAPFRAPTLVGDLSRRDFTINTMAFALEDEWDHANLIDILRGRRDLQEGTLRMCSESVLRSDPLRILKGLRHCLELGLAVEPETLLQMVQVTPDLRFVAAERIRAEMLRILCAPCETGFGISLLEETGVGRYFWGERFAEVTGLLVRTQIRCRQFWTILEGTALDLQGILDERVEEGLSRKHLLQWVFLLKNIHGDCALATARDWRFSRQALRRIEALERVDDDLWKDFSEVAGHRRAILLWAELYGADPFDLLLTTAFQGKQSPAASVEKILEPLGVILEGGTDCRVPDLVDGHFLRQQCRLQDGKEVGRILAALRKAEAYGEISGRQQAETFARAMVSNSD